MTSECLIDLIKYLKCYQGISNITKVSYLNCELNKHLTLKNTLQLLILCDSCDARCVFCEVTSIEN